MTGGTINNTSGADIVLTTNNAQNWNGDFTFTGTNSLNLGTGDVTLGGTAGQRTVTVSAGTLAVGTIPVATTGYGLTKAGPGTLSLTGTAANSASNIDGTLDLAAGTLEISQDLHVTGLTGSGTIQPYSTAGKWFFVNNATDATFPGVIRDASGFLGLNKSGSGKLTLTGANNYTLATNVQDGILEFSGTNNSTQLETIGSTASNGVLILSSGSSINVNYTTNAAVYGASMNIGTNAAGAGDVRVLPGSALTTSNQLAVGNAAAGSYGGLTQTGGSVQVGGFLTLGLGGSYSAINLSGGTFTMTGAPVTNGASTGGLGVMSLSGTAAFTNSSPVGWDTASNYVYWIGENCPGTLNVSDNASMTLTSLGLLFGRFGGSTGNSLNLLGGTITTPFVGLGAGTGSFNFNGGTLKANASSANFLTVTNAYVYSGGTKSMTAATPSPSVKHYLHRRLAPVTV